MTPTKTQSQIDPMEGAPSEQSSTVQLFVANDGNRRAIHEMLAVEFDVDTSQSIQDADLYLVEDRLLPKYRDGLREQVNRNHPAFCPVVVIQRDQTRQAVDWPDTQGRDSESPLLIDELVQAPVSKRLLVSRLRSLLVRRQQSLELLTQMETLARQERDLRRFERAFEDSGTATAITGSAGNIEYVNGEFEGMTGYSERAVLGDPLEQFLAEDALGRLDDAFWRTLAKQNEWGGELLIERQNGQRCITDTTITPIRDDGGETEGFVVVMPDITPRIEREQRLQDREAELDLLRQILTRYLRHNLRNGLNVILSNAELLEVKRPEQDTPEVRRIIKTVNRLSEMSEQARRYSALIDQESELAPYNVSVIVRELISEVSERYPDVSIDIEATDECRVLAKDGLREAIHGLIDNAARHNDADTPWVQITVTESDGAHVVIQDNGPGISELELETLERGTETPLTHSQGIGLWLSTRVIESIDGQLSFETKNEGGTRVAIEFPSTEHVETEDIAVSDLKAQEQRLKTITQRMTDAVIEVNPAWQITYVDAQAEEILAVDAEVIQGRFFWDVFADARNTRFEEMYRDVMQSRSAASLEEYYAGIDGWIEVFAYPDFDGGLSLYIRDVTDRAERERELERARSRMELALKVTDAAVWEWNPETDAVTSHPAEHPVFKKQLQTVDAFVDGVHSEDRARVQDALTTAVETGSSYDVEYRVQTGETVRWVEDYGEVQSDEGGNTQYLVGVARDITERKERERELRELEQFNRELVENAPVGLFRLDEQMRVIYENERAEEIMGVPEDEEESVAIGTDPRDLSSVGVSGAHDIFDRLEAGKSVSFELPFESLYGTKKYVTGQGVPLFDNGNFNGAILMVQDVTEQREREQLFEAVFNNTYTLTGVMDLDGTLQEANETALSFGGIDRHDVVGKQIWDTYWFQENQQAKQSTRKAVTHARKGDLFRDEIQVQGEDDMMVIDFTVRPVFDEDGSITFLIPEGRDITELKEREQQLEAERRRFQSLVDVLPHGVYRADPNTLETTYENDASERIHGYTNGDWRDTRDLWEQALHPDDAPTVKKTFQAHRESREPGQLEYRIQLNDGETRWIEDTFRWEHDDEGNVTALVGVYTDITDRKKREREELIRELEQSEEKLHLALEAGEMGLWELDLPSEESPVRTPQHDKIFGYESPIEDWSFDRFLEHVHPADRDRIAESFDEAIESGRLAFECRIHRVDGERRWIAAEGEFHFDSAGTPEYALGVVEDITKRKERENALVERVKELTAVQETAQTILRTDTALDDVFDEFIETLPQSFQYPEITAANIAYNEYEASTADFEPRERCLAAQCETENEGTVRIEVVYLEDRPPEDDGPFLTEEQELLDTLVSLLGGYVDRWEYIQQLQRQNKQLEAFSSIISHDLRNPLNVAQLRLESLKDECQSEHIGAIEDAHRRIETLIEDMLTQHGTPVSAAEPVVVSEIVDACWQTVETADATLVIETDQSIRADKSRLRQLLENVLRNAIEHGGPAVTVTVGDLDDGFYIEDDGSGIVPEEREAVFEAGYSTSSDGTGLGLSIVKDVADGHGWTCRVTDGTRGGTRIEIRE